MFWVILCVVVGIVVGALIYFSGDYEGFIYGGIASACFVFYGRNDCKRFSDGLCTIGNKNRNQNV